MPQSDGKGRNRREGLRSVAQGDVKDSHLGLAILHCNFGGLESVWMIMLGLRQSVDRLCKAWIHGLRWAIHGLSPIHAVSAYYIYTLCRLRTYSKSNTRVANSCLYSSTGDVMSEHYSAPWTRVLLWKCAKCSVLKSWLTEQSVCGATSVLLQTVGWSLVHQMLTVPTTINPEQKPAVGSRPGSIFTFREFYA